MSNLDRLNPSQHKVYRAIEKAARAGEACPKNDALCDLVGAKSPATVSAIVKRLETLGLIEVERFGVGRDVRFPALGIATAPWTGSRATHWRLRADTPKMRFGGSRGSIRTPIESTPPRFSVVDRDPCPRCGARRDIGCAHGRAPVSMGAFT